MVKHKEIGRLSLEGALVCFSMGEITRIASKLNISEEELVSKYEGILYSFGQDGTYGVDQLTAISNDGMTHSVIMIGGEPREFSRFLNDDELSFGEFYKNHPRRSEVGTGSNFNDEIFREIEQEYKNLLSPVVP